MKWLPTILFFFFVGLASTSFSQLLGDFRSFQGGNWSDPNSWEYYNGTSWISPPANTYYPGDGNVTTNNVYIIDNHTIRLNTNVNNLINSLTIGDQNGTAASISTLLIMGSYSLATNQISILYDGLLQWNWNYTLSLLSGTSIAIEKSSPYNPTTILGEHYGIYTDTACNVNKVINIGGVLYSNCNGGGKNHPPSFDELNNGGGSLSVSPTSNSPICSGLLVNLYANLNGTEAGTASFNWTVISPSNITYTLPSTIDTASDNPTETGTYLYEVTATANGLTATDTVSVEVISCNKTVITNRRITYRVKK